MRRFALSLKTISRISAWALAAAAILTAPAGAQITSEPLRPVSPFDVGAFNEPGEALPETLWRGSSAASARAAIDLAPDASRSAAVNRLMSRALLSGGAPPRGAEGDEDLASLRLDKAWTAGFAPQVMRLASGAPNNRSIPAIARIEAESELTLGDLQAACETAEGLREGRDDLFWLQLRAVCLAESGDPAASLTADLARGAGAGEDFETALALVRGDEDPGDVEPDSALLLGVALSQGAKLSLDLDKASRAVLAAMGAGAAPPGMQLAAARQAALLGLIDPASLGELYGAVEPEAAADGEDDGEEREEEGNGEGAAPAVTPAEMLALAMEEDGAMREALLYRAAREARDPSIRADAAWQALQDPEGAGHYLLMARLFHPVLAETEPQHRHGIDLARAAAAAGDGVLAREWKQAALQGPADFSGGAPLDYEQASQSLTSPLQGLEEPESAEKDAGGADDAPDEQTLAELDALIDLDPAAREELSVERRLQAMEDDPELALFDAMMLAAVGADSAPPELRVKVLESGLSTGNEVDPALLLAMEQAAGAGAMAETGLLAAAVLGEGGPREAAPGDLARVLSALQRAGLAEDARRLAVEAMLSRR